MTTSLLLRIALAVTAVAASAAVEAASPVDSGVRNIVLAKMVSSSSTRPDL